MYHDILPFGQMFPKHQFGGRCLLPFEIYLQLKRIYFGAEALRKPADSEPKDTQKASVHGGGSPLRRASTTSEIENLTLDPMAETSKHGAAEPISEMRVEEETSGKKENRN